MIREAGPGDLAALVALEAGFPEVDRFDRRTWRRLLAGQTIALVHESDSRIDASAVLLFRQGSDIARLYSISVDPAARGQGLGARLLSACEEQARARGSARLRLEVRPTNKSAHRLYDAAGYRVIARLESYYPDGEAALRMEKLLIAPSDGAP
ncbi:MAG: GNAT family N-acetyltransferase [Hyphomonas sp.]|uniref:GNAT family N-acetyltransferase n=1 Tax=Hyphomonas sp. TaxID=87 RepID=UPI0017F78052|nr:N-acetyltransferase [Hyphomonas sp.]MBU3921476.1 GNAT family N-acetyltransferase [Alphaproteobacteria bacterium]MBA3070214.1 GNAT family N-acetyltransferase [Hyphomonas sp.]MBU4060989.1 GNAT family N-acetyltransferase [Alphaproteobacteria bacterium]MBU4165359.1 GNAT family N-acetyltransferase [Alphaproteobacteria bacterium]MBU4569146.1 GNAT family N-acetyltransferase [Alphaproteobacteria bacterium]